MRSSNPPIPTEEFALNFSKIGAWHGARRAPLGFVARPGKPVHALGTGECAEYEGNGGAWWLCCRHGDGGIGCTRLTHDVGTWEHSPLYLRNPNEITHSVRHHTESQMPLRTRPKRPILTAMKNPCSRNPLPSGAIPVHAAIPAGSIAIKPGALGPMQVHLPAQPAQPASPQVAQQYAQQQYYRYPRYDASTWLPASTGPQPPGALTWVIWSGGTTGMKAHANSSSQESVQILQTMEGGPTGVMVSTAPIFALTNPGPSAPPGISPPAVNGVGCDVEYGGGGPAYTDTYRCTQRGSDGIWYRCIWHRRHELGVVHWNLYDCEQIDSTQAHYHGQGGIGGSGLHSLAPRPTYQPSIFRRIANRIAGR